MFKKATKKQSKLRLAISAPAGAGKTYTALRIASGMTKKIALIDTEFGSASKYASIFSFDTVSLENPTINMYLQAITEAESLGYEVLIIDSLTHAWDFLLEEIDKIANSKFMGNSFRAWAEGNPIQKRFLNSILKSKCHVICTMRTKTEYSIEKDEKGKTSIKKIGLAPRQKEGLEYEFDMLMEGTVDHYFTISKDRTGKFQDVIIEKPTEKFGEELITWLNEGEVVTEVVQAISYTRLHTLLVERSKKNKDKFFELLEKYSNKKTLEEIKFNEKLCEKSIYQAELDDEFLEAN